ncbi:MAG TPA: amidohydrolase family protein, partial [Mycobacteriales bacterium]|nr:amidohydrolase family protein [Mycobacteriales bacterium]
GLVGAALDRPEHTVELIADGEHVHPAPARVAWRPVGRDRLCLVSDAVDLGGDDGHATRLGDGTLAGARMGLDAAVRNVVSWGVPLADALLMASATPAGVAGRAALGTLDAGTPADLVLLDEDLTVAATLVGGVPVFERVAA